MYTILMLKKWAWVSIPVILKPILWFYGLKLLSQRIVGYLGTILLLSYFILDILRLVDCSSFICYGIFTWKRNKTYDWVLLFCKLPNSLSIFAIFNFTPVITSHAQKESPSSYVSCHLCFITMLLVLMRMFAQDEKYQIQIFNC